MNTFTKEQQKAIENIISDMIFGLYLPNLNVPKKFLAPNFVAHEVDVTGSLKEKVTTMKLVLFYFKNPSPELLCIVRNSMACYNDGSFSKESAIYRICNMFMEQFK